MDQVVSISTWPLSWICHAWVPNSSYIRLSNLTQGIQLVPQKIMLKIKQQQRIFWWKSWILWILWQNYTSLVCSIKLNSIKSSIKIKFNQKWNLSKVRISNTNALINSIPRPVIVMRFYCLCISRHQRRRTFNQVWSQSSLIIS